MEHPASPSQPHESWMASIWKMYITRCLRNHPDVIQVEILQGRYGGLSPKPTSLLILCGAGIDAQSHLETFATSDEVPAALKMGWDDQHKEYATAGLKTYPEALCHGLADLAGLWMRKRASFSTGVAEGPMRDFEQFSEDLSRGFNQEVGRGADLYIPVAL